MLRIPLIIFIILESLNVMILYFAPESKKGNGVAVFDSFEQSKSDMTNHLFIRYLINWVAGTKVIFIALLIVIVLFASDWVLLLTLIVLIPAIATYYWRLHPLIKDLDQRNAITPKGYSKVLGRMILGFIAMFIISLIIYVIYI